MIIRRFLSDDAEEVSKMIAKTLREVNIKDYTRQYIENFIQKIQAENIIERASWTHFYVVLDENQIIDLYAESALADGFYTVAQGFQRTDNPSVVTYDH